MRLGTCIAVEIVVAAGAIGGIVLGVGYTAGVAREYLSTKEAAAATTSRAPEPAAPAPAPPPHVERLPAATLAVTERPPLPTVYPKPDDDLLAPIHGAVTAAKLNKGGTSLSLRLDFATGARAAFKPEQTFLQSDPRREIAAFRIDRLLGIGHVPPAKSIAIPLAELVAGASDELRGYTEKRLTDDGVAHDGVLRGEVSWWIPDIKNARIDGVALDDPEGIATWSGYLQADRKAPIPAEVAPLVAQVSNVVVFDVVIDNADRWSGNNAKASPDGRTLYFMDNTLAFSPYTLGHETNLNPLHRAQVFSKGLIAKLRALSYAQIAQALAGNDDGGLAPLLTPIEIRAILARRDHVVAYIDGLIAAYGETKVLALP